MRTSKFAAQETTAQLRAEILEGEFLPGERLGEVELAGRFGVSRTPVREALRALESEGLVELQPGRGASVVDLTEQSLEAIFEMRARVEGLAAHNAATSLAADELERLRERASRISGIVEASSGSPDRADIAEIYDLNKQFHGAIVAASSSTLMARSFNEMIHTVVLMRTYQSFDPEALRRSAGHHLEIVAAFEARDGDWAESVMRSHLFSARASLLGPREG
jgi:DNA-binding GntR family transcriptional regulator